MKRSFLGFVLGKGFQFNAILGGLFSLVLLQATTTARERAGWELWNWTVSDLRFPPGISLFIICGMLSYAYGQFRTLKVVEREGGV